MKNKYSWDHFIIVDSNALLPQVISNIVINIGMQVISTVFCCLYAFILLVKCGYTMTFSYLKLGNAR